MAEPRDELTEESWASRREEPTPGDAPEDGAAGGGTPGGDDPGPVDAETEALLERSFAATATALAPVRERVLARIAEMPPPRPRRDGGRVAAPPLFGRHRALLLLVLGSAASLLLTAYFGYLSMVRIQRQTQIVQARVEVRNLAIVLRTFREASPEPATPREPCGALPNALARLGLAADPYGNAYACDAARIWSWGPNGRNEGGAGDDIAAAW
jgi:hypothetical protein